MPEAIGGLMGGLAAELMGVKAGGNRALLPEGRRDRSIGTPSAPNRAVKGESEFSWRSKDRQEQAPTDRLPARRGDLVMSRKTGTWEPRCAEGETWRRRRDGGEASAGRKAGGKGLAPEKAGMGVAGGAGTWGAMDQALRATDMLLQAGGFGVIVLDLGGIAPEAVWRIPMATWFRFRAAADRSRTCLVVLTQHSCARSSAELVLEMEPGEMQSEGRVMTGVTYGAKVGRQRFVAEAVRTKVISICEAEEGRGERERGCCDKEGEVRWGERRPPQPERTGAWHGTAAWAKACGVADVRSKAGERRVRERTGRRG